MDNEFLLYFTAAVACLLIAHHLGDYFVQTDHQAQHKGLRGARQREGQLNCAAHALTYTLTQIGMFSWVFGISGYEGPWLIVFALLLLNGVTHYVIDRRWTLEWFARGVLDKGGWIDNDPEALPKLDQAAHLVLFLPVALGIAAVSV